MNKVLLLGRIANDLELKEYNKFKYVNYSIAVENKTKDKKETHFIKCCAYGKTAESICKYLKKGEKTFVEGRIKPEEYTDSKGIKHYSYRVNITHVSFIDNHKNKDNEEIPYPYN